MEPREERRLTTILSADVVGFSRLMGQDESGTLTSLKAHRKQLFTPKERQYRGRTVKLVGDGSLMEFASVVDAVRFSIEVQSAMRERNVSVPEDRRINFHDFLGGAHSAIFSDGCVHRSSPWSGVLKRTAWSSRA